MSCDHLNDFLSLEIKLFKEHVGRHAWYNHIVDHEEALQDYIRKYGELIRQLYCEYICQHKNCECYEQIKGMKTP